MKRTILAVLVILSTGSIFYIYSYIIDLNTSQSVVLEARTKNNVQVNYNYDQADEYIEVEEKVNTIETSFNIERNKEIELINSIENYVGWISIDDTNIDYPVVKGKDNDFYLNHNYDLSENIAGSIFMDRRNLGNQYDEHTIIYGHYMKNGSMFSDLNLYLNEDFFMSNQMISFRDIFKNQTYRVISAYYVSADEYSLPFDLNIDTINNFLKLSLYETDYTYDETDRFLTLSTCNYNVNNGRMIVHSVLVK